MMIIMNPIRLIIFSFILALTLVSCNNPEPVTPPVTPPVTQLSSILNGTPTSDGFGWVTAISGQHALIAAPFSSTQSANAGSVYVYDEISVNNWIASGELWAMDIYANDQFGHSLSIDGNTAVVGAPFHDINKKDQGAAYVFNRDSLTNTWTLTQKLIAPIPNLNGQFGKSVAIDGNTMVISAWHHPQSAIRDVGEAFVFTKDKLSGQWLYQQSLTPSVPSKGQRFGTSVSIKENVAVVGSYWDTIDGYSKAGSAYVYERNSQNNTWAETGHLVAIDRYANNFFGGSVDTNGQVIVVGARENGAAALQAGSAYVFHKNNQGQWVQHAQLLASDAQVNDRFGRWVSITGNIIYSGTLRSDYNGLIDAGAVYRFDYQPFLGTWRQTDKIMPNTATANEHIGARLDADGKYLIIGAGFGHGAPAIVGSAYIYTFTKYPNISFSEQVSVDANSTLRQTHATIATLASGKSVITWSGGGIWYRIYDASGLPLTAAIKIPNTVYKSNYPDIIELGNNQFAITWLGQTLRGNEVFTAVYDEFGNTVVAPFAVSQDVNFAYNTLGDAMHPAIASLSNGDFLVVWDTIELGVRHVYLRHFSNAGVLLSSIIQLDSNQTHLVISKAENGIPDIDSNQNGDVVVAWGGELDANGNIGIVYRTFNINDANWLATPQQWLAQPIAGTGAKFARVMISMNKHGDIVATWAENNRSAPRKTAAMKIYNATQAMWSNNIALSYISPSQTSATDNYQPIAHIFNNQLVFVGWSVVMPDLTSEVVGQFFKSSGIAKSKPFVISQKNTITDNRLALSTFRVNANNIHINMSYEQVDNTGKPSQVMQKLYLFP